MHRPMRNALDDAVASVQAIHDAAVAGFFGASSIERLPTEVGIREQVEALKAAKG